MSRQREGPVGRTACAAGAVAAALLCGACATKSDPVTQDAAEAQQVLALSEAEGAYALDKRFALDRSEIKVGEDGTVTGGKRSEFEGQRNVSFGGDWDGQRYEKKSYEKSRWGGRKTAVDKSYAGNLDGSRFRAEAVMMGRTAAQGSKRSVYDGRTAASPGFHTGTAAEQSAGELARPSHAHTDWKDSTFQQPKIRGYKQQQQMDIEETRRLLGRD